MSFSASSKTHTTVTDTTKTAPADTPSIRHLCLFGIMTGLPKEVTEQKVKELHGEAAGAKKFSTHYSWYKGWLNKKASEKDIAGLNKRFGTTWGENVEPEREEGDDEQE